MDNLEWDCESLLHVDGLAGGALIIFLLSQTNGPLYSISLLQSCQQKRRPGEARRYRN